LERSLYNGFLSGVSLDGERYFYVNPLQSRGGVERPEWYGCACCPPNVMRQIAMVGHYAATADADGVQIHQYMPAVVSAGPDSATSLRLETCYPWDGDVTVTVATTPEAPWRLSLRVPAWCTAGSVGVNDESAQSIAGGRYAGIERRWQAGDVVRLKLPMVPRIIEANPRVDALRSSLAVERGPMVYCLEEVDQAPGLSLLDVRIPRNAPMRVHGRQDLLGGVVAVEIEGAAVDIGDWEMQLYRPAGTPDTSPLPEREATLTAIPYYAWANRGPGAMRVWIPALD
jgi:DUF1680 family protein